MAALALDTVGFLQAVNRLERRFDELTSPESIRDLYEHPDEHDPVDHRLYTLASDVFGCGGWTTTICVAAASCIGDLIDECKRFMTGSASVVRKYGMAVWLYDLINAATKALYVQEPSSRMPMVIQPVNHRELAKRCSRTDKRRYGKKAERLRSMADHAEQMHWLGAYGMLRWGEREPRSLEMAGMLLTHPGLGMCMLRDDDKVMALGASPDVRYRRPVDYLRRLRVAADLDYARALADGGAPALDGERAPGFADVDQRYVYDAERLVESYEAMWDDDRCAHRSGHEILAEIERSGVKPHIPLWRNPAYLHDLAESLMGPWFAADLSAGFDERDRARFDEAAARLRDFADFVREVGFVMLPVCVLDTYAVRRPEDVAERPPRHADHCDSRPCDSNAVDDDARDTMLHVGAGMAAVAIARMPSENLARAMGMALLQCDPSRYSRLVLELMDGSQPASDRSEHATASVA